MSFTHANMVSILIAAVAAWIFGGIYYTALSKPWIAAQGKTLEQCKAEQDTKSGIAKGAPFVVVFISEVIIGWVLYGILLHINAFTVRAGVISAALCWFGFVLTTIATNNAFGGRRAMLTVIDSVAWLGAFVIIGAIVGGWGP
ncbi:MAG TPA: DUF1761 domain-containing protein [Pseudolabrys sp.]|jgi:hypothetical protein|nr:DUF1761 domain-containing protein [Pseudolabrys sp.]